MYIFHSEEEHKIFESIHNECEFNLNYENIDKTTVEPRIVYFLHSNTKFNKL